MKDCCVRCEIQIAFFFNFLIFLFNTFYCSILDYIFFRFVLAFEFGNSNSFCLFFCFQALNFTVPVSHNLDVQFYCGLAFFSRGVHFLVIVFFFSIANYYSWVVKD
jgi:hypothetical protein